MMASAHAAAGIPAASTAMRAHSRSGIDVDEVQDGIRTEDGLRIEQHRELQFHIAELGFEGERLFQRRSGHQAVVLRACQREKEKQAGACRRRAARCRFPERRNVWMHTNETPQASETLRILRRHVEAIEDLSRGCEMRIDAERVLELLEGGSSLAELQVGEAEIVGGDGAGGIQFGG